MARIRTVKPELFKHEDLYDLERETGLPIRVAFIGLFTCCDKEGRFKWRPRTLKLDVLPHDEVDFSRVLDALTTRGFVLKYAIDDDEFGVIPTFSKHQVINNRESESEIPAPEENSYVSMTLTREARVLDALTTPLKHAQGEGKGKEGKGRGKEGKENATAAPTLPDWLPPEAWESWNKFRRAKSGKAWTDDAQKLSVDTLTKFWNDGQNPVAVIQQSIERGWTGLFAIKDQHQGTFNGVLQPNKQEALEIRNRQVAARVAEQLRRERNEA